MAAKKIDYRIYGEPYYIFTRSYQLIVEAFGADSTLAKKFYAQSMRLAAQTDRGKAASELFKLYYGKADTVEDALRLIENPQFATSLSKLFTGDNSLAEAWRKYPAFRRKEADFLYHYPFNYHYYDLKYSDLQRFLDWKKDFDKQLQSKKVAAFHYIWLPNDHTAGTNPNFLNPYQLLAQNDAALGKIVETIAKSPIWKNSLILIVEDDAQNGPDHVDATRTVALAVGPYVKRQAVISDHYDQLSLLRTVEVILGVDPMNINDGLAVPMFSIFQPQPNYRAYVFAHPSNYLTDADKNSFTPNFFLSILFSTISLRVQALYFTVIDPYRTSKRCEICTQTTKISAMECSQDISVVCAASRGSFAAIATLVSFANPNTLRVGYGYGWFFRLDVESNAISDSR